MFFKFLIFVLLLSVNVSAQEDLLIKEIIDGMVDDLPDDLDLSELSERLLYFKKHPLSINHTNQDELKKLFFLSPLQITNLLAYISANGKLIDVLELQAVPGFDGATVQKLLLFIRLNESDLNEKITFNTLRRIGENDLVVRYGQTLEKQKGFRNLPGSRYLGSPQKFLLRYKYNFSNRITLSLVSEKDAGEKPLDFISANLTVNDIGIIKKISLGDYSLQFGQGLTLWSGFGFGKGPDVTSIAKKDDGLKPYSSANEYSFLRGIGTTIRLSKEIDLTSFWSSRKHDAAINNELVTTLNETGYHRTANELRNRKNIHQTLYGFAANYSKNTLNMGIMAYRSHYSKGFTTGEQVYRAFNFIGKQLTNMGFHYNYSLKNTYFFGEITKSLKGGAALMNGFLISLSNQTSAVFLYRNYQRDYHNFFSQAPSESGGVNENGFYMGLNISPSKKWMISLYADYFTFPWLKFRVDAPSKGYEILGQISYTPSKQFKAIARYKTELKQQNTDLEVPINYLDPVNKTYVRINADWKVSKTISLQNKVEFSAYQKGNSNTELGFLIYQDFAFTSSRAKLSSNFRVGYFRTPSYNSRIYTYEDDILYNFSFGMYNGSGFRNYINFNYKLVKNTDLWFRYAIFLYQNSTVVGSGLDEINGRKKTDIKIQVRYQF